MAEERSRRGRIDEKSAALTPAEEENYDDDGGGGGDPLNGQPLYPASKWHQFRVLFRRMMPVWCFSGNDVWAYSM